MDKDNIIKSFENKETLSPIIFDKNKDDFILNEKIRKKILEITDKFIDFLGVKFFIHDIILTGSIANFNWSKYSDVDIHIMVDFKDTDIDVKLLKEFFDSKKNIWNDKHQIIIKNHDVELYVQDVKEDHTSTGVYSILNNKWLIKPLYEDKIVNEKKILEKSSFFIKEIDKLYKSKDNINSKKVERLKNKIKNFRKCGLSKNGEFSYENLTFKLLRRTGYIEKLFKLGNDIIDNELSI